MWQMRRVRLIISCQKGHKLAVFKAKTTYKNCSGSQICKHNWDQSLPQTDRQTEKFFDTIYGVCRFFLSFKFASSLLASLAGG